MDVVYSTIAFSETGLFGRLEVIKPALETIRDNPRKQLIDMAQKRDGPIVLQQGLVTFLEEEYHHVSVPYLWHNTFEQDEIKGI